MYEDIVEGWENGISGRHRFNREQEVVFSTVEPPHKETNNKRKTYEFRQKTRKELHRPDRGLPSVKARNELMDNPDAVTLMQQTIRACRMAFRMAPVRSNQELIERIDQYFDMAQGREIPPTVEEFSLYLGYDVAALSDWANQVRPGFPDVPFPGASTQEIVKRALQFLHAIDAVQVSKGHLNSVAYIFRSKNYYGMRDTQEQIVKVQPVVPEALPASEIAKMLPEISVIDGQDARDVTDDYDII